MAWGNHLLPFRTQKLSPIAVTILRFRGKIARCRILHKSHLYGWLFAFSNNLQRCGIVLGMLWFTYILVVIMYMVVYYCQGKISNLEFDKNRYTKKDTKRLFSRQMNSWSHMTGLFWGYRKPARPETRKYLLAYRLVVFVGVAIILILFYRTMSNLNTQESTVQVVALYSNSFKV